VSGKLAGKVALVTGAGSGIGRASAEAMAAAALERFGRIDVLMNNAGVLDAYEPAAETTEETWRRAASTSTGSSSGGNGGAAEMTSKHRDRLGTGPRLYLDHARATLGVTSRRRLPRRRGLRFQVTDLDRNQRAEPQRRNGD
jgi:NAD(P)-dependent dehydrogenase (short-subunit alcohol dehydrogenase family)